ncbi:MAG TPA: lysine--tRNA ligase [Candidatus Nanoarchaeia archaeon]|nr:lysine--tRNA ligase [Candidatus Nanoarchaeia archaeon]
MKEEQTSKYWLDLTAADIIKKHPKGEIIVASGISPSASYHVGHFREVLTADALAWAIRKAGREAKHLHFSDNFDPLRRRYEFLPEEFEKYVGWPICLIPDPFGDCHSNYAKHYYAEFEESASRMGVEMYPIFSYEDQYQVGKMTPYIEKTLEHIDEIREVFERVSGRKLDADWTPVQVINPVTNNFFNASLKTWDKAKQTIEGVDYTSGNAKLNWRLDWPSRWHLWSVDVEPFGRELATKGSSYDTGKEFVKLFGGEAPYPVPYDTINLVGETKKMSSSLGNLVTPDEALSVMPAEVLRYFVVRSKPDRTLVFDSGLGLYNLIEEYSKIESALERGEDHEFKEAYELARTGSKDRVISSVPFSHLVAVYQAAQGEFGEMVAILERTGYEEAVKKEADVLRKEADYVKNWLAKYAPESVKFAVQKKLPKVELSGEQKTFLAELADGIEAEKGLSGQGMHDLVYAKAEKAGLRPPQAFVAIYRVVLAKDSGPKAGWFLASLDTSWLIHRLRLQA